MTVYKFADIAFNSTEKKKPEPSDKDVYIGLEHLDPGILEITRYGAEVAPKGDKLVMRKGDVLFGRRRAYQKKVAIAPCDGIFSAHGMVLRPKQGIVDPGFFPFFISSDCFLDEAIRVSVGSLSPTANWKDLKELAFDLPSLSKQRKIAEVMRAAERTKAGYRALIKASDDLVKSQFVEMFGDPRFQKNNLVKLGDYIELINGYAFKSENFCAEGIPVVKIANVNNANFRYGSMQFHPYDTNLERFIVMPGDVLISLTGTVGKDDFGRVCVVDSNFNRYYLNQRNACLRHGPELNSLYLVYLLRNEYIHSELIRSGTGVRQCHLHNANIENVKFVLPNVVLQNDFSVFVRQVDKSKFT